MPLTGQWLSHPVACTFIATTALWNALLDLRRTPIPFPGHDALPGRIAREPDSERRWRARVDDCRTLAADLLGGTTDADIWKDLEPALAVSLSDPTRAGQAAELLAVLRHTLKLQPASAGTTWIPPADWWASVTTTLAQPVAITPSDRDVESQTVNSPGPDPLASPRASSNSRNEAATADRAVVGGQANEMCCAAFVPTRHLARPEPDEGELTQAALAFRELAVIHGQTRWEDLFRRLAIRGCPYHRLAGRFAADSATEALWVFAGHVCDALVRAVLSVLPSGAVEADRIRAGVVHWSELGLACGLVRECCERWADTLEFAYGLTSQLDLESEFLQQADERALLTSALRSGMDEVREKIRRLAPQWKMTVGARLLLLVAGNPREVLGWSAGEIAAKLNCAKATVIESKEWQLFRTLQDAERKRRR
jgi:hypothetical protein